jgi:SH3-like domain-containing protein
MRFFVKKLRKFSFAALTAAIFHCASADSSFVSLKSAGINFRVGPGKEYPISWKFMRAHLPVMLIAEFDEWKKVKFFDRTEGWVHQNMVSRKNTALVVSQYTILYRYASESHPIAKIEKNVIVKVQKVDRDWIKVEVNKFKGWVKKKDLWGVNENSSH